MGLVELLWRWLNPGTNYVTTQPPGETPEEFANRNDAEVCNLIMIPVCGEWLVFGEFEYYAELHWPIGTGVRRRL